VKKKIIRQYQFLKAVLIAARYGIERFTLPEILSACLSVLKQIFSNKTADASKLIWFSRVKKCLKCPVFDSRRLTCGSPFSTHPELGCYCFMPIKAKMNSATCWLDENSDGSTEYGWKEIKP
jgi:hypothetical protein